MRIAQYVRYATMLGFVTDDHIWENLKSAITLIQRRESTIPTIIFPVLIHYACPHKNYIPKCSQLLTNYLIIHFFKQADTLSRKKRPDNLISVAICIVEPFYASWLPILLY